MARVIPSRHPTQRPRIMVAEPPDGDTLQAFAQCDKDVQVVMGPLGSGKTHTTIEKIVRMMANQTPDAEGMRRSRWAAIRNTYPDLRGTTIKDWLELVPDSLGRFKDTQPPIWTGSFRLKDGTRVRTEMIFLSLDRPADEKKLRGYQLTGVWFNEMKEVPQILFQQAFGRTGRYPAKADVQHYWSGVIGDTNAWDEDHWLHELVEKQRPANVGFYRQPGGVIWDPEREEFKPNPNAENLNNLKPGYYVRQLELNRHRPDWVRVNLANEYGSVMTGRPVWPEFSEAVHVLKEDGEYVDGRTLYIGIDFGRTPAAVWGQRDSYGRMVILGDLTSENMGAIAFGKLLRRDLTERYGSGWLKHYIATGDPAGSQRTQVDERTPFLALEEAGIEAWPADTNDWTTRRESVARMLVELIEGKPAMLVSPSATKVRAALRGGYQFRRLQVVGQERFQDYPDKNEHSHPGDALQYLALGAGEGDFRGGADIDMPEVDGSELDYSDVWAPEVSL